MTTRTGFRVGLLFAVYGAIGFGGEYLTGLLAQDHAPGDAPVRIGTEGDADVGVALERELATAVRVRQSRECAYAVEREVAIPVSDARLLSIDAGSGELVVEGRAGQSEVLAVGRVCASHEEYLEDLRLSVERVGSEIVLSAHYPESRRWSGRSTARIDLEVSMPLGMALDIDDSSGSMEVFASGDLRVEDSSGSILVVGANGSVRIEDSSGELEIRDVAGDVEVSDGSGEIDVRDVQGTVRVRDGSGGIDVAEVDQDVIIEGDGSGGIDVRNVGGSLLVERDGSGGIRYGDIEGPVDIPADKLRRGGR